MDEVYDRDIIDAVRRFVERDVIPHASELEHRDEYPHAMVATMKELGLVRRDDSRPNTAGWG